jgi:rhamnogalacturonan endolyase
MWVGSHYGGTTLSVAQNESWTKVVGPFVLYCNSVSTNSQSEAAQSQLWQDAVARAEKESSLWPYEWVSDANYPSASNRGIVRGEIVFRDPLAPDLKLSNLWVGVTAPDYVPPARFGFGFRGALANSATNAPGRGFGFGRGGLPPYVDWQRDAKFYQFWTRADAQGRFSIPNVRGGTYALHAFGDGVLGEFTLTNISVAIGEQKSLGQLNWTPPRFGRTVWQIGVPDRTAREFRHGDNYWHWGLYFDYPKEFPNDVNFVVGKSDWRRDWNYVQPPRIESRDVPVASEEDEQNETTAPPPSRIGNIRSSTWSISFVMPAKPQGKATLRLAFCGTHVGCHVEAFVNDQSIGDTGTLPSTSAMQRDGIRAYWIEKDLPFDAASLTGSTNSIRLLSHANSWSQGVMYDCIRLELDESKP